MFGYAIPQGEAQALYFKAATAANTKKKKHR
jgi:hypothetical protein